MEHKVSQKCSNALTEWAERNELNINKDSTAIMIFRKAATDFMEQSPS
jgi:hypothetical protein